MKSKEKETKKEEIQLMTEADNELNSSEWFGAILRYFWYLGKRDFNSFYNPKELRKNVLIGYIVKIIVIIAILITVIYYSQK